MLTDRQRVELALPARMMFNAVISAAVEKDEAGAIIVSSLKIACNEPLDGLPDKDRAKIARRIERASLTLSEPYVGKCTAGKLAMVVFYFTESLIERGILELYEGSPMAKAMGDFLPQLQGLFGVEAMDRSAKKQGERMVEQSRRLGFYGT